MNVIFKLIYVTGVLFYLLYLTNGNPIDCLTHFKCRIGAEKKTVSCNDYGIDDIPLCLNPSLLSIKFQNTKIHKLYLTSFRYYSDLRYINLSNNTIDNIERKPFEKQINLEELHLDNNKISFLDVEIFFGLINLTVLSLRGNLLENFPAGIFHQLTNLKHLDLSHNLITTLEEDTLKGLTSLLVLHLEQNKLSQVPAATFKLVPHLSEVSLGGNSFDSIHSADFEYLSALDSLDLSSTNLELSLGPNTFQFIRGLRKLKLNDCNFSAIPTTSLLRLTQLEEVELNQNQFVEIPANSFKTNTRLKKLLITGCNLLTRLAPGAFMNNLNIFHLEISRNPNLTFLPPEELKTLSQLSYLDLHGNNLQYIPEDAVSWSEVSLWLIHDNPIRCNCSVAWLRRLLLLKKNSSASAAPFTIRCQQPRELKGHAIVSTELEDLRCGLDATTQGIVIAFSVCFVVLIVAGLALVLLYRHRDSCIRNLLKRRRKWQSGTGASANDRSYDSEIPCIKSYKDKVVPVTEL